MVRINIPTVNVSDTWTPTPLRKQRLATHILRLYLPCLLIVSLVLNIYYFTRPEPLALGRTRPRPSSTGDQRAYTEVDFKQLTDLVIVPGHGVYQGNGTPLDESNWFLQPEQVGSVGAFMAHIGKAVEIVKEHDTALLLFSGGATRAGAGAQSEAQGYWAAADRMGWLTGSVYRRVMTEQYARDSYENVLFSVARFREITGRYPDRITVVGFDFKRERFIELHRRALNYPKIRFNYIGINPPGSVESMAKGERANAYELFSKDLYGCSGRLREKREGRNPFRMSHGYRRSCPEIAEFFDYCPKNPVQVYEGALPWLS
ncbi:hypothetical protein EC988_001001 [Linderina pennispora]|nr:hypothetical protein EC988_001001 [Linderina pennispora]